MLINAGFFVESKILKRMTINILFFSFQGEREENSCYFRISHSSFTSRLRHGNDK